MKATEQSTPLYEGICTLVHSARQAVAGGVDLLQVYTNYEIGRRIVEQEQRGEDRAEYGKELIKELSGRLTNEPQLVLPAVLKVVFVQKPLSNPEVKIRQTHLSGIFRKERSANAVHTEVFAVYPETMKMEVAPPEGKLKCIVKISNALVGANQKPSPDQRTDAPQQSVKLINLGNMHEPNAIKMAICLLAPGLPRSPW